MPASFFPQGFFPVYSIIILIVLTGLGYALIFGMRPLPEDTSMSTISNKSITPNNQIDCESQGGQWGSFGLAQNEQCNLPTKDGGKECRDGSECESGVCFTDDHVKEGTAGVGKCYGWTISTGTCLNRVDGGTVQGVICVD